MAQPIRTPNFQRLKVAAGSNDPYDWLHAGFVQDYTENDQLLRVLGEQRDQLAVRVDWLEALLEEGESFLPLHENCDIGVDRLNETLKRERKVLANLIKTIESARKGREEKKITFSGLNDGVSICGNIFCWCF